jgi:hypothetical protein
MHHIEYPGKICLQLFTLLIFTSYAALLCAYIITKMLERLHLSFRLGLGAELIHIQDAPIERKLHRKLETNKDVIPKKAFWGIET